MRTFALYKLPYADEITEIVASNDNDVEEIYSYAKLSNKQGFVIAPFALSKDCPIVVIQPKTIRRYSIDELLSEKLLKRSVLAIESLCEDSNLPYENKQKQHALTIGCRLNGNNIQDKKILENASPIRGYGSNMNDLPPEKKVEKSMFQNEGQHKKSIQSGLDGRSTMQISTDKQHENGIQSRLDGCSTMQTSTNEQHNNGNQSGLDDCPTMQTSTDKQHEISNHTGENQTEEGLILEENNRKSYAIDFANFHSHICSDEFTKLVLARKATYKSHEPISPLTLFARACHRYPRMFVALVATEKSGIWLTATPEILLEGHENKWRTMALAGTMKLKGEQMDLDTPPTPDSKIANTDLIWSTKNRAEQRIVATYVTQCLEQFTSDFSEEGPFSTRAGDLVHLRSDFKFTLNSKQSIGQLIETLHPTPAVCGLPKHKACQFILENEISPRRYYSGFMGPLNINGDTHLFVTLRCMEINSNRYSLYAGGGLLKDSEEEKEWRETEMKMETMKQCLQTRKI